MIVIELKEGCCKTDQNLTEDQLEDIIAKILNNLQAEFYNFDSQLKASDHTLNCNTSSTLVEIYMGQISNSWSIYRCFQD